MGIMAVKGWKHFNAFVSTFIARSKQLSSLDKAHSTSWMADSQITTVKNLKSHKVNELNGLIRAFVSGYELVAMMPASTTAAINRDCSSSSSIPWQSTFMISRLSYGEHHSFNAKLDSWMLQWQKLQTTAKNVRSKQAVILIKGVKPLLTSKRSRQ